MLSVESRDGRKGLGFGGEAEMEENELEEGEACYYQGESPSSSTSDVDNLNNQAALDKVGLAKGFTSQVTGNHVIVAQNRPNFVRLLSFAQDVNFAMEASKKSQNAFAAFNISLEKSQFRDTFSSVKRVLAFNSKMWGDCYVLYGSQWRILAVEFPVVVEIMLLLFITLGKQVLRRCPSD